MSDWEEAVPEFPDIEVKVLDDVPAFVNAASEHRILDRVDFRFAESFAMDELATAVQSSTVKFVMLIKEVPGDTSPILRALQSTKQLQYIQLFEPSDEEFEALACALQNTNLKTLQYYDSLYTALPPRSWAPVVPVLQTHPSIQRLLLAGIKGPAFHALGQILSLNTSIQYLSINEYDNAITAEDMTHLVSGFTRNKTMKRLFIGGMTSNALGLLCEAFEHNKILVEDLFLVRDELSHDNIAKLGKSLQTNTLLRSLKAHNLFIDATSCQLFSEGLASNTGIQKLEVHLNECGVDGARHFFDALKANKTVHELKLHLVDEQSEQLAEYIALNAPLKKIELSYGLLRDDGMKRICRAMDSNTNLTDLTFGPSDMHFVEYDSVSRMLKATSTLRTLQINCPTEEHVDQLCNGLNDNTSLTSCSICFFGAKDWNLNTIVCDKMIDVLERNLALESVDVEGQVPTQFKPYFTRNIKLKSNLLVAVATLSHNIARDDGAVTTLPREIWISVLSKVTQPGTPSFEPLIKGIFDGYRYHDRKHEHSQ